MANHEIYAPTKRRRMLVFDVETTGKIKKGGVVAEQPHIIQLSFVVYDLAERCVIKSFDSYVKIGADVELSDFICELTGASRAKCNSGMDIIDVLKVFYEAYMWCDGLVAHNIEFDTQMIEFEMKRNRPRFLDVAPYCLLMFNNIYEKMHNIERYCTMKKGTKLCALTQQVVAPHTVVRPSVVFSGINPVLASIVQDEVARPVVRSNKWPKLTELHEKLFGVLPAVSHDARADTMACLRCYVKMRHGYDVGMSNV